MANQQNEYLIKALNEAGRLFAKQVVAELGKAGKKATGNLINSISFNTDIPSLTIQILGLDYLKWVDKGRKPGIAPPVSKILPWVKLKKIKFGKSDLQTAFIIARSIAKKGIKPANVISKSKKATKKGVSRLIANGAAMDLQRKVRDSFK